MTLRAVILGLLGACFIASAGFLNDCVASLSPIAGHNFPTSVFGLLFILVMLVNPVLRRIRSNWAFHPPELAVSIALMLVGCSIPGCGLMVYFPPATVMPIHFNRTMPGWQKYNLLEKYVPPSMLVADGRDDSKVVEGFVNKMGEPGAPIGLSDVPWGEWSATLTTWLPLILLIALSVICLSLIVHRQWSKHESLRYPIAEFATTLMSEGPQKGPKSIFRNRLFWLGVGVLLTIRVINGLHEWYPNSIEIPMQFRLANFVYKLPDVEARWRMKTLYIYPTVIAFCFLISSEIGLSLGLSQVALVFASAAVMNAGVNLSGDRWIGSVVDWQRFGSYLGIALIVLYTGRHYYRRILTRAITLRRGGVEGYAVWACRILLVAIIALVAMLSSLGLAWPLALAAVLLIMMTFLVMARINAESGLFVISPNWTPLCVLMGLFGAAALGPKAVIVVGLLSIVFTVDSVEALMPFMVNGLKMCGTFDIKPRRVGWGTAGTFAVALAIAVPVVLWANQNFGLNMDYLGSKGAPEQLFNTAEQAATKLTLSAQLEESNAMSAWERVKNMDPDSRFLWAAGTGLLLVVVFSVLRLRFTWWPIHPVIFVLWGSYSLGYLAYSFLIGWFIRRMVTKFGGAQKYRQVRILMFGVIAGELLGRLIFMIVGAIYYAKTGQAPKSSRFYLG